VPARVTVGARFCAVREADARLSRRSDRGPEPVPGTEKLAINLATVRKQWGLREAVEGCARMGIRGVAPWRDQLRETGLGESARILRSNGMRVTGLCRGGFFAANDATERRRNLDDNRRAIEEAATIGAECLILVCGGLPQGSRDLEGARHMVEDGIAAILDEALSAGVPLAIEPLHPMYAGDRSVVSTLAQALTICDGLGNQGVGVAVDVYHVWWDPDLAAQLERCGQKRLLAFHICDWLVPTRDLLEDRGMMGDGVVDIPRIREMVRAQGYEGLNEVEIFSRDWWSRDPFNVLAVCIERHESRC
jgi:sugar phosphate isomerase/epimerase